MKTPVISADKLCVRKQSDTILRELTFTVEPGKIVGLIGPSGSGKTTLMRALVGVQRISKGQLTIDGYPAGSSVLRRKIGYVSQAASVYQDLTVEQNLNYFATIIGAKKSQVKDVIESVQLDNKAGQLVSRLSGGQKARVSLAVALLGNPSILVLDEPTVGLDPLLRQELWEMFGELARDGKTLIISSHVMDEAERCEDLLLMRDGKLLWQASRTELLKSTNKNSVEDAFIAMVSKGVK